MCVACSRTQSKCSPNGSVWLTIARISLAEDLYHTRNGRFGKLADLTDLQPGLPADLMNSGRMGDYAFTIELTRAGYIARAVPDAGLSRARLTAFYADQTGKITMNRSGQPAGPDSRPMSPTNQTVWEKVADWIER